MNAWKHGITVGAVTALLATPALSQTQKFSFGVHGGVMKPGAVAEAGSTELKVDTELSYGGGMELWFGRVGLRGDFSYMENTFEPQITGEPAMYFADGALLFRLLNPVPDRKFAPFLSLGAGGVWWDPNEPPERERPFFVDYPAADVRVDTETAGEFAVVAGIGADWFLVPNAALRLEVKDYFVESPYMRLSAPDEKHDWHHNVNFSAGLQIFLGGGVDEPGFVSRPEPAPAPAPAPRPAPQPRPEPEPEPRFETVSMCVVGDNGRLMNVNAVRNLDTRALYVERGGNRIAFETAYPVREPHYVRSATWYVADRPLVLDLDEAAGAENRIEFVRFGATSTVAMNDLVYVGEVDDMPLYVRTSAAGPIRADIERHLRTTTDLEDILEGDRGLAERFGGIETYYVAVEPGCVFQPVSSTMIVRRTRG